ncbi:MAG: YdcF family protein [Clostridia bacterium]|nr:YdcF family protein [Clostridia bacterium]
MIAAAAIKTILICIGTVFVLHSAVLFVTTNITLGNFLVAFLGAFLLLYGIFYGFVRSRLPLWIRIAVFSVLAAVLIFIVFLMIYGSADSSTGKEDAVIVLGAGLRGDRVSRALAARLDKAADYLEKNTQAVAVVSGGMGRGETVTEASAMKKYLIEKGIPEERILTEEKSTSTFENFVFSKEILDSYFNGIDYSALFVTNDYHVFRSVLTSVKAGFGSIGHIHSTTGIYYLAPGTLRECIGVLKYLIMGK